MKMKHSKIVNVVLRTSKLKAVQDYTLSYTYTEDKRRGYCLETNSK